MAASLLSPLRVLGLTCIQKESSAQGVWIYFVRVPLPALQVKSPECRSLFQLSFCPDWAAHSRRRKFAAIRIGFAPFAISPRRPDVLCLFACPASRSSGNKLSWTCGLCWVIERDSPGRAFGRWKITFQLHVDGLRSEVWFRFRFEKFLKSFDAWNLDKYGFLLEELEKLGF